MLFVSMCVCMYVYVCMDGWKDACMYIYMYIVRKYVCVCMLYVSMCACIYLYVCMHVCIYDTLNTLLSTAVSTR